MVTTSPSPQCSLGCSPTKSPPICRVTLEGQGEINVYLLCRYHRESIARRDWDNVTILEEETL